MLHHNTSPTWYEEIKIQLPVHITSQHHLLFSFHHISCDSKKKELANSLESPVGFAWLPLLNKGKLNIDEQVLPVAASLPAGYLSIQPLGLGRGVSVACVVVVIVDVVVIRPGACLTKLIVSIVLFIWKLTWCLSRSISLSTHFHVNSFKHS